MTAAALIAFGLVGTAPSGVPRSECFPVETLPIELRAEAEDLLLKILDGEGLYTLVGGLKPISSGWFGTRIAVESPQLDGADRARRIAQTFRSGQDIVASIQPFWRVYEGSRYLDGFIYHRKSVAETVRTHRQLFGFWGLSPHSDPVQVVMAFEVDATPRRSRAYGYLFGYPKHAVDFFVQSEQAQRATGKFVERDFISIPTFGAATNRFIYAVPKGHTPNDDDRTLRERADRILAYYRELRPKYIGTGKPGAARLLRDWFDDGTGRCSPETALAKVERRR